MTFAVNRAARRTFYLEKYAAFWLVPKVWQVGAIATPEAAMALLTRALATEPKERWLAEQADEGLDTAPWYSVIMRPRGDPNDDATRWDVLREYRTGEHIQPGDLAPPNVLVVGATIIPRARRGDHGVRLLSRDPHIQLSSLQAAHRILEHGELPTDSGRLDDKSHLT
jgi:hypothetical protein